MSNNPAATLTRPARLIGPVRPPVAFCLATRTITLDDGTDTEVTCTRIAGHPAHCCDEVAGVAWNACSKKLVKCPSRHDHSAEKGL